jgi:hypothetical protein
MFPSDSQVKGHKAHLRPPFRRRLGMAALFHGAREGELLQVLHLPVCSLWNPKRRWASKQAGRSFRWCSTQVILLCSDPEPDDRGRSRAQFT